MSSLHERALAAGVAVDYEDWAGNPVAVPDATVERVLGILQVSPAATGSALVAEPLPLPARGWGWMVQLYAVRSAHSWGIGDFADLERLLVWSAGLGADFVLLNPLHAVAPVLPQQPSPYFPTSRRFVNPLYLAIEQVPGAPTDAAATARAACVERIDRDAVFRAKDDSLRAAFRRADADALAAYRMQRGATLEQFATFCAHARLHGPDWRDWPASLAEADTGEVAYHCWLQQLADAQLSRAQDAARAAGMRIGLITDLAVGADPGGADAWAMQDELADGVSVGAPPDSFNRDGQDWQFPPLRPDRLAASDAAALRDLLRHVLRGAGGVRIDHALGLFRLFWVPAGASPAQGTYVRYPAELLLRAVTDEARATGAVVVAEDLGTVPDGVPEALRSWGLLTSSVAWFERTDDDRAVLPPEQWPDGTFASVTTHDLPTAAGVFDGTAPPLRPDRDVGAELCDALVRFGLASADADVDELVVACHALLARTPATLLAVALGDAVGDRRQPNLPGSDDYPSWRLPLAGHDGTPLTLEEVQTSELLQRVVAAIQG